MPNREGCSSEDRIHQLLLVTAKIQGLRKQLAGNCQGISAILWEGELASGQVSKSIKLAHDGHENL